MKSAPLNAICAMAAAALVACGGGEPAGTRSQPATGESASAPAGQVGPAASMVVSAPGAADSAAEPRPNADPLLLNRIGEELDQVEGNLRRFADQQDAFEVIRDVRLELQKDAPNRLKVRGLVGALAQALTQVQGLAKSAELLGRLASLV